MTQKEEEYIFLKRKPRIFLIGNPYKLGFKNAGDVLITDSDGIRWVDFIDAAIDLIFNNERVKGTPVPYALYAEWIGQDYYIVESPKDYVSFDEQGYAEFYNLLKRIQDDELNIGEQDNAKVKALFEYSPPIKDYAIPHPQKQRSLRQQYTMFTRLLCYYRQQRYENREKIKELTKQINEIA